MYFLPGPWMEPSGVFCDSFVDLDYCIFHLTELLQYVSFHLIYIVTVFVTLIWLCWLLSSFYSSSISVVDLSVGQEEQVLNDNQPDLDDCEGCEIQDEEAVAMIEELPSGILIICCVVSRLFIWASTIKHYIFLP